MKKEEEKKKEKENEKRKEENKNKKWIGKGKNEKNKENKKWEKSMPLLQTSVIVKIEQDPDVSFAKFQEKIVLGTVILPDNNVYYES